jgi:hypothetical protein
LSGRTAAQYSACGFLPPVTLGGQWRSNASNGESQQAFEDLLRARGGPPQPRRRWPLRRGPARGTRRFSTFDPEQALAAGALSLGLAVVAAAAPSRDEGLEAALDTARRAAETDDPELVHHALRSSPPTAGRAGCSRSRVA